MRIAFFGSGDFAIPTFQSLCADGHEVAAVVSQPDRPAGRGKAPSATPLRVFAESLGHRVRTDENVNAPDVIAALRSVEADLGYVAAFGQKLGPDLLALFPLGVVNLHGSLLPAYRGAAPVQWAMIRGERETGVSVFRMVEAMDAGPVLARRRTLIRDDETADELTDRLARIGCDCLREALNRLSRDPSDPGEPQDPAQVTRAPKLRKSDGSVGFDEPAERVARRINGLWSWPAAACEFQSADGKRRETVLLARAVPLPESSASDPPGVVTADLTLAAGRHGRIAEASRGAVEIREIRPAGARLMTWRDFVNGRRVRPGDRFECPGAPHD